MNAYRLTRRERREEKMRALVLKFWAEKSHEMFREMCGMTEAEFAAVPPGTNLREFLAARFGLSKEAAEGHIRLVLQAEMREPGLGVSVFRDVIAITHTGTFLKLEEEEQRERLKDLLPRFARFTEMRIEDFLRKFFAEAEEDAEELIEACCAELPGLLDHTPPPTGERRRAQEGLRGGDGP